MKLFRRKRPTVLHSFHVQIEPTVWMRFMATSAGDAVAQAQRLAPNGRGPWTVRDSAP